MITYNTASGSVYDVDGLMVRRRVRSKISDSERVSADWREAKEINFDGLNKPLIIIWGTGRDEHSENAVQVGVSDSDDLPTRMTVTTAVVSYVESDSEMN